MVSPTLPSATPTRGVAPRGETSYILAREAAMPLDSDPEQPYEDEDPAVRLQRMADRVASMIVTSSCSDLDCALAERELRMECLSLFPDRMDLYDRIYASRFRRLREQFRS
jgi:hypothetical protein